MDDFAEVVAGVWAAACLRFPRENHDVEVDGVLGALEVVEVTEVFRDKPSLGILLLSSSFVAFLAGREPCVPREAILSDELRNLW